ncbi:OmpA family protein [Streptobacillus moniliformis]|uniref:OmpA family protein n=1 Tax=Streptobacillus moniliformis TaxID=34105 RepID=UPI0007E3031C|nr:OmpA family protein [Streptobacillus moniliformis]
MKKILVINLLISAIGTLSYSNSNIEPIKVVAPAIAMKKEGKIDENERRIEILENENIELNEKLEKLSMLIKNIEEKQNKEKEVYTIYGFNSNKFTLNKNQMAIIDALITNLENKEIIVVGYTDTDGNDKYNLNLGLSRANSVKAYLESKGIKVLVSKSVGFNELIKDNNTIENKALNRRVEIIVK